MGARHARVHERRMRQVQVQAATGPCTMRLSSNNVTRPAIAIDILYSLSLMVISRRFLSMARHCIVLHPTCSWTMRFPFCSSTTNFDSSASRYGLMISLLQMPPGVSPLPVLTDVAGVCPGQGQIWEGRAQSRSRPALDGTCSSR